MANPYTSVSIISYNSNAPPDDGSESASNQVTWAKHKTKLGDPLKTGIEGVNTNTAAAFLKSIGVAPAVTTAVDYTAAAADQGKLIVNTGASKTHTTPDATAVAAPFSYAVQNNHATSDLTLDGHLTQTINGAATLVLRPGGGGILMTDGTNWLFFGSGIDGTSEFAAGTVGIFGQTAAPAGWTKDVSFDDAAIALTSGAVGDVAGTALSAILAARTITQANLPAINLTSDTTGSHVHSTERYGSLLAGLSGSGSGWAGSSFNTNVAAGDHAHTVPLGGSGTPMDFAAKRAKVIRATKA